MTRLCIPWWMCFVVLLGALSFSRNSRNDYWYSNRRFVSSQKVPKNPLFPQKKRVFPKKTISWVCTANETPNAHFPPFWMVSSPYVTHRHKGDRRIESPWRGGVAPFEKTLREVKLLSYVSKVSRII